MNLSSKKPRSVTISSERLRHALLIEGMTARDLALKVNVSEETIGRYVRDESAPQAVTLQLIATALRRPPGFFLAEPQNVAGSPIFWRSFAAATKTARSRAEAGYTFFRAAADYAQRFVELPTPHFPPAIAADPLGLSDEDIEDAAAAARAFWGLGNGPIANVVRLLEHHGGAVGRTLFGASTLDAFSQWATPDERPFFVLGMDKPSAVRERWNAVHELGHMILHRNMAREVHADPALHKEIERQAHYFAGAFLLPAESFGRSVFVPTLNALLMQKGAWKVSVAAMIMRLRNLGLINEAQDTRLWQSYSRSGYRRNEPGDDHIAPEEPQVFRRAMEVLFADRTPGQVMADLILREDDLQGILNLPLGAWRDWGPEVRLRGAPTTETRVLHMPKRT